MKRSALATTMLCCLVSLTSISVSAARQGQHPAGCAENLTTAARQLMLKPVALTPASGKLHQEVSTKSAEAQAFYDQGFAWLASYTWIEAARSFEAAIRLDPELAMAHMGLAKAYTGADLKAEAASHRKRAEELAAVKGKVTDKEAQWIALASLQAEAVAAPEKERSKKHEAYKKKIDDLIKSDPDDTNAWILRGNAEETGAWGRGQGGRVGSIAYYEAALTRDPDNLAAHHFLVHSYENIGRYEEAAEHAKVYVAQCPLVPHAHHMHGHVLPRLGKWEDARAEFTEADRLERLYYTAERIAADQDWHHGHNLHLLGTVERRMGRDKEAELLYKEAFDLKEREPLGAGWYATPYVEYLLGKGRFEEALTAARVLQSRQFGMQHYAGEALACQALLGLGRLDDAKKSASKAAALYRIARRETSETPSTRPSPREHPYKETLAGLFELHGRHPEKGEKRLIKMADELAASTRFDAWGAGLFNLDRIAAEASRAGRPKLVADLAERMKKIDPDFKSEAATQKVASGN